MQSFSSSLPSLAERERFSRAQSLVDDRMSFSICEGAGPVVLTPGAVAVRFAPGGVVRRADGEAPLPLAAPVGAGVEVAFARWVEVAFAAVEVAREEVLRVGEDVPVEEEEAPVEREVPVEPPQPAASRPATSAMASAPVSLA